MLPTIILLNDSKDLDGNQITCLLFFLYMVTWYKSLFGSLFAKTFYKFVWKFVTPKLFKIS